MAIKRSFIMTVYLNLWRVLSLIIPIKTALDISLLKAKNELVE